MQIISPSNYSVEVLGLMQAVGFDPGVGDIWVRTRPGRGSRPDFATVHFAPDCDDLAGHPMAHMSMRDWAEHDRNRTLAVPLCRRCDDPIRDRLSQLGDHPWVCEVWIDEVVAKLADIGDPILGCSLETLAATSGTTRTPSYQLEAATLSDCVSLVASVHYLLFRAETFVLPELRRLEQSEPHWAGIRGLMMVVEALTSRLRAALEHLKGNETARRATWLAAATVAENAERQQASQALALYGPGELAVLRALHQWARTASAPQAPAPVAPSRLDTICDLDGARTWVCVAPSSIYDFHTLEHIALLHRDALLTGPGPGVVRPGLATVLVRVPTKLALCLPAIENGAWQVCGPDEGFDLAAVAQAIELLSGASDLPDQLIDTVRAVLASRI